MKYFNSCNTLDEVRAIYKKLALQHRSDRGGDTATMQEVNKEYAFATAQMLNGDGFTQQQKEREMRFTEIYREVLAKIMHLDGIFVELVGLWIWVTGNTQPHRAALKDAGFWWAPRKQAWYHRAEEFKMLHGGKKTLDEIRARYGSEKIVEDKQRKITRY